MLYNKDMKKLLHHISILFLTSLLLASLFGCTSPKVEATGKTVLSVGYAIREKLEELHAPPELTVSEDGKYTSKEEVALYLHLYGHLPSNYITKTKARKQGWVAEEGNLWEVTDHMSIGGGEFTNQEGKLPKKKKRVYYECDIDYEGGPRNAKRIVWSNDGLIYYTDDHYNTFELLYGGPDD